MPIDCCYFVDKAAAAGAAPALKKFCSILHCPAVFTQNLGPLLADLIQPECYKLNLGVGILNDAYNKNWPILGNFICGHHLSYFDALFAVNTHANFNLVFVYAKGCLANFRNDAGGSEKRPWCGCCQPPSELLRLLLPGSSYVWQQHRHHGHRRGSYRLSWNKQEMQKTLPTLQPSSIPSPTYLQEFQSMEPLKQELAEYLDYDAFCGAQRQPVR